MIKLYMDIYTRETKRGYQDVLTVFYHYKNIKLF